MEWNGDQRAPRLARRNRPSPRSLGSVRLLVATRTYRKLFQHIEYMPNSTRYGRYRVWTKKKRKVKRGRERGGNDDGGIWWNFYVRSYGGLSRLCSEGPWHLSIFCPFSPKLFSYLRSLSDRHTFLKIDSRSTATVTRSQRERERLLKPTSNRRCQTDSVLNSCLGSLLRFSLKEKERSWSFFLFYRSILLSLFLILPMTSFSIYLASVYLARVSSSTCLSLDLRCINSSPSQ